MNYLWGGMILVGVVYAAMTGNLGAVQEVTGSSPVPSTKTRAFDFGQGLFCCVIHEPTSDPDGTGLEQHVPSAAKAIKAPVGL